MNNDNENDDTGVIYCLTNIINSKKYIGQALSYIINHGKIKKHGLEGRFIEHCTAANNGKDYCTKLYFAMRKYGTQNFTKELLLICPLNLLDEKETFYINKFNTIKNGYNITLGKTFSKLQKKEIK